MGFPTKPPQCEQEPARKQAILNVHVIATGKDHHINRYNIYRMLQHPIVSIINPRRMREGYGSLFVCVCVSVSVCLLPR